MHLRPWDPKATYFYNYTNSSKPKQNKMKQQTVWKYTIVF